MHLLVLDLLHQWFRLDILSLALPIFVTTTLVFVVSYGISAVFHSLPVLKNTLSGTNS